MITNKVKNAYLLLVAFFISGCITKEDMEAVALQTVEKQKQIFLDQLLDAGILILSGLVLFILVKVVIKWLSHED